MTKQPLSIVVALFLGVSTALRADELRLTAENLPQMVRERHPALKASERLVQAAKMRTGFWRRSMNPHLNVTLGGERYETGPYAAETQPYALGEAAINVFRGGKDRLEDVQRQAYVKIAEAEHETLFREELEKVRRFYWQFVAEQERMVHIDALLEQGKRIRQAAERRVAKGLTTDTDVLAVDLYNQQLEEEKKSSLNEMRLSHIALQAPLNISSGTVITTEGRIPHERVENAQRNNADIPSVVRLQAQREINESQRAQWSRWWAPELDFYGQYGLYTRRDRDFSQRSDRVDWAAGLRARFSLFDGGNSLQEAKSSKQQAAAYGELAAYRERAFDADVETALQKMRNLDDLIHGSEIFLERGEKLLRQTLSEYDRGVRDSQEVLAALDRLAVFQRRHLERRLEYQNTKTHWQALTGGQ